MKVRWNPIRISAAISLAVSILIFIFTLWLSTIRPAFCLRDACIDYDLTLSSLFSLSIAFGQIFIVSGIIELWRTKRISNLVNHYHINRKNWVEGRVRSFIRRAEQLERAYRSGRKENVVQLLKGMHNSANSANFRFSNLREIVKHVISTDPDALTLEAKWDDLMWYFEQVSDELLVWAEDHLESRLSGLETPPIYIPTSDELAVRLRECGIREDAERFWRPIRTVTGEFRND